MDFLPLDNQGEMPTVDFRHIGNNQWVGLNAACDSIPLEAAAFINHHRSQRISDEFQPKGPSGLFLDTQTGSILKWAGGLTYHSLQKDHWNGISSLIKAPQWTLP